MRSAHYEPQPNTNWALSRLPKKQTQSSVTIVYWNALFISVENEFDGSAGYSAYSTQRCQVTALRCFTLSIFAKNHGLLVGLPDLFHFSHEQHFKAR